MCWSPARGTFRTARYSANETEPGGDGQACSGARGREPGLAAAGAAGRAKLLARGTRSGMMAEWPVMAARTGLDTTHGQPAVSRGRCCWARAGNSGRPGPPGDRPGLRRGRRCAGTAGPRLVSAGGRRRASRARPAPGTDPARGCRSGPGGVRIVRSGGPAIRLPRRHQVDALLDGLDILRLEETERDGHAFSGPKHWHTFDILARKPTSNHPSAPASR